MSVEARETLAARRRGNGGEMSRMAIGYRLHMDRVRAEIRRYDREQELAGVTFAPEDVVDLLERAGYGYDHQS